MYVSASIRSKSFIMILLTAALSGLTAFALLNILCAFYYRLPRHFDNALGTTDYVWEPRSSWVKMTEGISFGRMDEAGFNNPNVIAQPDVLILGSSHMEATNVCQSENTAYRLGALLRGHGAPLAVYNRGISGHHFLKCCKYLAENVRASRPRYVVIETMSIRFSAEEIGRLLSGRIDVTPSYTSGILYRLQALPFFRLLYLQIHDGLLALLLPRPSFAPAQASSSPEPADGAPDGDGLPPIDAAVRTAYDQLFAYIAGQKGGADVIIVYHPAGSPAEDGSLSFQTDEAYLRLFRETAERYGITVADLTAPSEELWRTEHKATHGFCTGPAFTGHLNRNGHRLAARELASVILRKEGSGHAAF